MVVTLFTNISSLFIQELSNFADTVSCMSESVGQTFRSAEEVSFPLSPLLSMKNSFYDIVSSGSPCYNDFFIFVTFYRLRTIVGNLLMVTEHWVYWKL